MGSKDLKTGVQQLFRRTATLTGRLVNDEMTDLNSGTHGGD